MSFSIKGAFGLLKSEQSETRSEQRSVGIDVGSSSIKVVELHQTDAALTLSTYGELQLGPYSDKAVGTAIKFDHEQASRALVDVVRESGAVAKKGVLAIPLASSFLTTVSLTAADDVEVAKMIPVEARKYIPIPLNEISLDWSEISQTENETDKTITRNILMAAIQNQSLSHFQRLLADVGMLSQPIEIEAFSTIRAVVKDTTTATAIIDLGASLSKLYVVKGFNLQKIHRVKVGGEMITKRISDLQSVQFGDAERIKREMALDPTYEKDVKTAMKSILERPFQEFKRVIQQYETQSGETIKQIHLVGGGTALAPLAAYVSDVFAAEPVAVNVFDKVAYPAFMEDTLKELGPSFAVALGAAMRPFLE